MFIFYCAFQEPKVASQNNKIIQAVDKKRQAICL